MDSGQAFVNAGLGAYLKNGLGLTGNSSFRTTRTEAMQADLKGL
jgi:hypothetical protein